MLFEPGETAELLVIIRLAIEPSINRSPRAGSEIYQGEIAPPHEFVDWPIRFREQIAQFHHSLIPRDASQSIADPSSGTIMTLSKTSCQDQDSFFHDC